MSADEYGHVKISRRAYETDPFWLERREFSRWEAWEWMIQAASWKPREWALKQALGVVRLERGETPPLSVRHLADVWGWSKSKVSRFVQTLGESDMNRIRDSRSTPDGDTYIIVNYDTYQTSRDSSFRSLGDSSGTAAGQQRDSNTEASKQVSLSLPTGEKNTHTPARTRADRSTRRCPAEWQPNDGHRQLALSLGVDMLAELEFFRDYTFAKGHSDWDATFRNWIRTAAEKQARSNGNGNGRPAVTPTGEDAGELQRRRQREVDAAEEEYQAQRSAWKQLIAERWEAEPPEVQARIRTAAESEFQHLRADAQRFKRAVDPRAVQLYADEIHLPPPNKKPP
jgi:hypothetical protein